jgi:hypothetical protein
MLYAISHTVEGPADLIRVMRPFTPIFAGLLLCWSIAIVAIGWTSMADSNHLYLYALAVYPIVLFSAVFEKVLISRHGIRAVGMIVGLFAAFTAGALLIGHDMDYYVVVLIICVATYPLVLAIFVSPRFLPVISIAILLAGIGGLAIGGFLVVAAGAAVLAAGLAILLPRLSL